MFLVHPSRKSFPAVMATTHEASYIFTRLFKIRKITAK